MAAARRQPPLKPSSSTNRVFDRRPPSSATNRSANDEDFSIATGKPIPRSYLIKLIKGARRNGFLNLASRGLTEGKRKILRFFVFVDRRTLLSVPPEVFLQEIVEDENQRTQKVKVPDFNQNDGETWWSQEPLKNFDLSSNFLTAIPNEIEELNYLVVLNVNRFDVRRRKSFFSMKTVFRRKTIKSIHFRIRFDVCESSRNSF